VGRDSRSRRRTSSASRFQSTRPRGARHIFLYAAHIPADISIHAPSRGATLRSSASFRTVVISIHAPSRGATCGHAHQTRSRLISIHAPAWGATVQEERRLLRVGISIHAPAWGATGLSCHAPTSFADFNPRARVGRDWASPSRPHAARHFNPRARVGRDRANHPASKHYCEFQSTRRTVAVADRLVNFNPRAPRGARPAFTQGGTLDE